VGWPRSITGVRTFKQALASPHPGTEEHSPIGHGHLLVRRFELPLGPLRCRGPQIALEGLLRLELNQSDRSSSFSGRNVESS